MKKSFLLPVVWFVTALAAAAATEAPKFEIRANSVNVNTNDQIEIFNGSAVALIGEMRVSAEKMIVERETGILRCVGASTIEITARGMRVTGTDITIDTKSGKARIVGATITSPPLQVDAQKPKL